MLYMKQRAARGPQMLMFMAPGPQTEADTCPR